MRWVDWGCDHNDDCYAEEHPELGRLLWKEKGKSCGPQKHESPGSEVDCSNCAPMVTVG